MHALSPHDGGLRRIATFASLLSLSLISIHASALCVVTLMLSSLYARLAASPRRSYPPPQGRDPRPTPCGRIAHLARASPLSCALDDTLD
eukprot:3367427-Pleurochrysis_carterae.AAC.1